MVQFVRGTTLPELPRDLLSLCLLCSLVFTYCSYLPNLSDNNQDSDVWDLIYEIFTSCPKVYIFLLPFSYKIWSQTFRCDATIIIGHAAIWSSPHILTINCAKRLHSPMSFMNPTCFSTKYGGTQIIFPLQKEKKVVWLICLNCHCLFLGKVRWISRWNMWCTLGGVCGWFHFRLWSACRWGWSN